MRALILLAILLSGCASMPPDKQAVYAAHGADIASTAVGLAAGAAEANPLGVLLIPVKVILTENCDRQPEPARTGCLHAVEAVAWSATANNIAWLVNPVVAPFVGLIAGISKWQQGAPMRDFMAACAVHRELTKNPHLKCEHA